MLKIRLQKVGKKNAPSYRVVLAEHTAKPQGRFIEILGHYNPRLKQKGFKKERIEHWFSKGAQASPTVHNLLVDAKIIEADKLKAWRPKKKSAKKADREAPTPEGVGVPTSPPEAENVGKRPVESPKEETKSADEAEPKSEEIKPEEKIEEAPKEEEKKEEVKEEPKEEKKEEGLDPSPNLPEKDTTEDKSTEK